MVSLSEEWIFLSESMYGGVFIDELAALLAVHNVKTVLELCCGGGHVLYGLAERGFSGLGVDADPGMIAHASAHRSHPNVRYALADATSFSSTERYDGVICRGNSLVCLTSWGANSIDISRAEASVRTCLGVAVSHLNDGGLLYLDTVAQREVDAQGGALAKEFPGIHLDVEIRHDMSRSLRRIDAKGVVLGEPFSNVSVSYLLAPAKLEAMLAEFPLANVWRQPMAHESNYDVICAKK